MTCEEHEVEMFLGLLMLTQCTPQLNEDNVSIPQ